MVDEYSLNELKYANDLMTGKIHIKFHDCLLLFKRTPAGVTWYLTISPLFHVLVYLERGVLGLLIQGGMAQ